MKTTETFHPLFVLFIFTTSFLGTIVGASETVRILDNHTYEITNGRFGSNDDKPFWCDINEVRTEY